jgi:hypothetical protein
MCREPYDTVSTYTGHEDPGKESARIGEGR